MAAGAEALRRWEAVWRCHARHMDAQRLQLRGQVEVGSKGSLSNEINKLPSQKK